ncbi:peptidase C14, caspase domain-containing protein, partial [Armillaria mellea]
IWAVLVGIDNYEHSPLHGCVADTLAMKAYLADNLFIPKERIQTLLGPYNTVTDASSLPSRARILSLLLSLATNPDIEHGDPIIIFFAGHGSRYLLSEHDDNEEYDDNECPPTFVETFCPMDRDSLDSSGVPIPNITDRELNTILSHISCTKGRQITFVVDCCHTGGVTR